MESITTSVIRTTGGVLSYSDVQRIYDCICDVFNCTPEDIRDLAPLQKGLSNSVLSFGYNGGKYVFRFPGNDSEMLVDRGRESIVQKQIEEVGVDTTLVAMNVKDGWRISRFIENRNFNYQDINDMVRAMLILRKLHKVTPKVRWDFDLKERWEYLRSLIPANEYGENFKDFPEFAIIRDRVYYLYDLAKTDGIKRCLNHGDCRDENFLINDDEIFLIDWEYAGFGDPGFDIGTYVCGGNHTEDQVDRILYTYFGRVPSTKEYRHYIAYIAISGFFFMHWTMFKESGGQPIGYLKQLWYSYADRYSRKAMELYK